MSNNVPNQRSISYNQLLECGTTIVQCNVRLKQKSRLINSSVFKTIYRHVYSA